MVFTVIGSLPRTPFRFLAISTRSCCRCCYDILIWSLAVADSRRCYRRYHRRHRRRGLRDRRLRGDVNRAVRLFNSHPR